MRVTAVSAAEFCRFVPHFVMQVCPISMAEGYGATKLEGFVAIVCYITSKYFVRPHPDTHTVQTPKTLPPKGLTDDSKLSIGESVGGCWHCA